MIKLLIPCFLILFTSTLAAQGISYQAIARDATGELLSERRISVRLSIYPGENSSVLLYSEAHELQTNAYGGFSLRIGEGTPIRGDFQELDWSAAPYYLGVSLDVGDGLVDLGRAPLGQVPYSFHAHTADRVPGLDLNALVDVSSANARDGQVLKWDAAGRQWRPADDLVASGGGAVNTAARISGDGSASRPLDLARQGAQNGQVLTWQNNAWTPANPPVANFQAGAGIAIQGNTIINTGITANTDAGGDLSGKFPNLTVAGLRGRPISANAPANGQVLKWNGSAWAPAADVAGEQTPWNTRGSDIFYNDGNVGVGAVAPSERLQVDGGILMGNTNNTTNGTLRWTGADFEGRKGNQWVSLTAQGGADLWSQTGSAIHYGAGNVGLGLNNPSYLMHLRGASPALMIENSGTSPAFLRFRRSGDGANDHYLALGSQGQMVMRVGGADRVTILNNGNVGVGTSNAGNRLQVNGDVQVSGKIKRNATGNANLAPICYGHINDTGGILNGSGNFSVKKLGPGHYQIDVQGESLSGQNYTAVVSARGSSPAVATWGIADFNLVIFTHNMLGIRSDSIFSFVLYKP
jgi:hypothetical protein